MLLFQIDERIQASERESWSKENNVSTINDYFMLKAVSAVAQTQMHFNLYSILKMKMAIWLQWHKQKWTNVTSDTSSSEHIGFQQQKKSSYTQQKELKAVT